MTFNEIYDPKRQNFYFCSMAVTWNLYQPMRAFVRIIDYLSIWFEKVFLNIL